MNWKTWIPLVLAAALGVIAVKAGRALLAHAQRAGVGETQFAKIVVARSDLDLGRELAEGDLVIASVPSESVPRGAFFQSKDVVGRVVIQPLVQRQPILESALAAVGASTAAQGLVPQGMRATTVQVDEVSGVAGLLSPGCHVDVVSAIQDEKLNQVVARTIVEDVKVLAVGQRMTAPEKKDADESTRSKSVTLLVNPRDAEAIELASSTGRAPRLVLRGVRDAQRVATQGITAAELLGGERKKPEVAAAPVVSPQAPTPVVAQAALPKPAVRFIEVIRNGAVTRIEVPAEGAAPAIADTNAEAAPLTPR
jgi:pilus assembly protein CpaB